MVRAAADNDRYGWVDVAKGICIVLVVLMHSLLGVEKATGTTTWLNDFVLWAQPFRMPDFFLISGLFLASRINRPWGAYLDTKVVHFAYFYVLWLTIQLAVKAPAIMGEGGTQALVSTWLWSFVEPFGTLWFIYLLAVFFVIVKALSHVPRWIVFLGAAVMNVAAPETNSFILNEAMSRFVFFYSGYAAAPYVFAFADRVKEVAVVPLLAGLGAWAIFNTAGVSSGLALTDGPSLVYSYAGVAAVIATSVLITTRTSLANLVLAYCGRHSIAIYLAFTLFMGPTRIVLLKVTGGAVPELVALASMTAGIVGALLLRRIVEGTALGFLFERPAAFRLQPAPKPAAAVTA